MPDIWKPETCRTEGNRITRTSQRTGENWRQGNQEQGELEQLGTQYSIEQLNPEFRRTLESREKPQSIRSKDSM